MTLTLPRRTQAEKEKANQNSSQAGLCWGGISGRQTILTSGEEDEGTGLPDSARHCKLLDLDVDPCAASTWRVAGGAATKLLLENLFRFLLGGGGGGGCLRVRPAAAAAAAGWDMPAWLEVATPQPAPPPPPPMLAMFAVSCQERPMLALHSRRGRKNRTSRK